MEGVPLGQEASHQAVRLEEEDLGLQGENDGIKKKKALKINKKCEVLRNKT